MSAFGDPLPPKRVKDNISSLKNAILDGCCYWYCVSSGGGRYRDPYSANNKVIVVNFFSLHWLHTSWDVLYPRWSKSLESFINAGFSFLKYLHWSATYICEEPDYTGCSDVCT